MVENHVNWTSSPQGTFKNQQIQHCQSTRDTLS